MTRREAIGALEYLISGECTDTQMDYVDEIRMAINDMKICEANNAGWISVMVRKPEAIPGTGEYFRKENKPVLLLAGKHGAVYVGWYIGEDYRGIDCYISRTSLNAFQYITRKITHWMQIPELCEEDRQ